MTDAGVLHIGSQSTSATLLEQLRRADPEAWRRFVFLYGPLVYRWCRRGGLQEADAKEVGQEVFTAVAQAIGRYEHRSFRAWLRTITNHKVLDHVRRQPLGVVGIGGSDAQRGVEALPAGTPPSSGELEEQDDRLLLLRRATDLVLETCQEATRKAFLRIVIGDEDPTTVAADLGLTENAVRLAKSRLLRRIRDEFAELVEELDAKSGE